MGWDVYYRGLCYLGAIVCYAAMAILLTGLSEPIAKRFAFTCFVVAAVAAALSILLYEFAVLGCASVMRRSVIMTVVSTGLFLSGGWLVISFWGLSAGDDGRRA